MIDETNILTRPFESFQGDLMNTRIYTLDNGLKVYMSVQKSEPRIYTSIAFRAGSKNDPPQTTGLAHYMEHMLFKGTPEFGTNNWQEESELLSQIADLYEQHLQTQDVSEKKRIYQEIDRLSYQAAELAIPNEYDKMVSWIGAKGTNAYTSNDRTVYLNDIPSNELEKWLKLEANRFNQLVLRLFHTELETVYEEYNRALDNDYRKSWVSINKGLFEKHPYRIPIIGKGEHIKNPSMYNIYEFFSQYYRPNNAAICLAGDFDPDETIALIEKYFGNWQAVEIPPFDFEPEASITAPKIYENWGTQTDHLYCAFRLDGANSRDALMMKLVGTMLQNDIAGLFDTNLLQQQKVLNVASMEVIWENYSSHVFFGLPKQGQTLEEVQQLILAEIEKLKNGDFEDWLIPAVIKHLKIRQLKSFRSNRGRVGFMVDAFTLRLGYQQALSLFDDMEQIDKATVMDFVQQNYHENYVLAYKRQGIDQNMERVNKPPITPIPINRDAESHFFKKFKAMQTPALSPVFLDFEEAIHTSYLKKNEQKRKLSYIQNKSDEIFKLYYLFDIGRVHDLDLELALGYLSYLGTSRFSPTELQKEFFKNGLEFRVVCNQRKSYIYLSGLEEALPKGVELLEHILSDVQVEREAYRELVSDIFKKRQDNQLAKDVILQHAMFNFAAYGPHSPFTYVLSNEALMQKDPKQLAERIKQLKHESFELFYYGSHNQEAVETILQDKVNLGDNSLLGREPVQFEAREQQNQVLVYDYEQMQVEILLVASKQVFNPNILAAKSIFNEYFGAGLSSIVFQEIREAKALAYSAYAWFTTPNYQDQHHFIKSYLGTQPDKLQEAVDCFLYLMNNMPRAEQQFEAARKAALKNIESERITDDEIFWTYQNTLNKGLNEDIRKRVYQEIQTMTLDNLEAFFNEHVKSSNFTFLVLGKKELLDQKILEQLGAVQILDAKDIFNY